MAKPVQGNVVEVQGLHSSNMAKFCISLNSAVISCWRVMKMIGACVSRPRLLDCDPWNFGNRVESHRVGRKFCNLIGFFHTPGFLRQFFVSPFPIFATGVRNQCGVHLSHYAVFVFFLHGLLGFDSCSEAALMACYMQKRAGLQHRLQLFATGMKGA